MNKGTKYAIFSTPVGNFEKSEKSTPGIGNIRFLMLFSCSWRNFGHFLPLAKFFTKCKKFFLSVESRPTSADPSKNSFMKDFMKEFGISWRNFLKGSVDFQRSEKIFYISKKFFAKGKKCPKFRQEPEKIIKIRIFHIPGVDLERFSHLKIPLGVPLAVT